MVIPAETRFAKMVISNPLEQRRLNENCFVFSLRCRIKGNYFVFLYSFPGLTGFDSKEVGL